MDWYVGCGLEDLVVPSNQDMLNTFPSQNSWSQCELLSSEGFDPMSKTVFTGSEFSYYGKSQNTVGTNLFEYQQDENSINSSFCQEFTEGLVNQGTSQCDVSDYQLDDLDMTIQTNDVFLNSSNDISSDTSTGPCTYYNPEFEKDQYGVLPSDHLLENMIIGSQCDPTHLTGMRSSKLLKTHASQSVGGCDRLLKDEAPSQVKAQHEEVSVSREFEVMDGDINKETTSEASVLHQLEQVITQMSDHTRICLRDAMYRLAENSRQEAMDLTLEKVPPLTEDDGIFRSENAKNMETKTNTIDRAVANLMFYKMDSDVQKLSHCHSRLAGDAEVPIFT